MKRALFVAAVAVITTILAACEREPDTREQQQPAAQPSIEEDHLSPQQREELAQRAHAAWQQAGASLQETRDSAALLLLAVNELLTSPTDDTLAQAQKRWREVALRYQPFHLYSSLGELQPEAFRTLRHLSYNIGAQPIQPGYLDNFGPYTYSGLVHDIGVPVTPETLREQHGLTDAEDATLGLYALQFMLFGYSEEEPRNAADYAAQELGTEDTEQGFSAAEELPENRRRQLLRLQAELLLEDLQHLTRLWQPEADASLYQVFTSYSPLRRYLMLLRSSRLELSQVSSELGQLHSLQESATGDETSEAAEEVAFAANTPLVFLEARVQHVRELAKIMKVSEELQASLKHAHQTLGKVEPEGSAEATEEAVEAIAQAVDRLAEERERLAPTQSATPNG